MEVHFSSALSYELLHVSHFYDYWALATAQKLFLKGSNVGNFTLPFQGFSCTADVIDIFSGLYPEISERKQFKMAAKKFHNFISEN